MKKQTLAFNTVRRAQQDTINQFLPPGLRGMAHAPTWQDRLRADAEKEMAANFDVKKELHRAIEARLAAGLDAPEHLR